ncbi:MAG: hypothetical protein KatS3mg050_3250 [Litorilinea sp.]|nr:MAG: hypothetical protein KatS3mg050_3250 [Litorilinea sp.]
MASGKSVQPQASPVAIGPPRGRAMLQWEGKQAPQQVIAPPAIQLEAHRALAAEREAGEPAWDAPADETTAEDPSNRLFYGDNKAVLAHLLRPPPHGPGLGGQVRLIYIDPPFDSGSDYTRKIRLRTGRRPVVGEQVQYGDRWPGDSYLQFMYERLLLLRELLAEDGSIWVHCDYRQVHRLHLLLEEVFGPENYLNTIAWRSQVARGAKVNAFYFPFSTQYIEIFAKNRAAPTLWQPQKKRLIFTRRQAAARFMEDERGFFRTSDPGTYSFARLKALHAEGRLYAPYGGDIIVDEKQRRVYASNGGNIGVKYYLTDLGDGRYAVERGVDNLWDDIPGLGTTPGEDVGYPTQKTEALLRRIIAASTRPGDLVLDCFVGSGTSVVVAQKMGRRWIAADLNYGAIQTTRQRLQRLGAAPGGRPTPGFTLWQVGEPPPPASEPAGTAVDLEIRRRAGEDGQTAGHWVEVRIRDYRTDALAAWLRSHPRPDWRALVDAVEIDMAYDGQIFRSCLVDVPAHRRAQVSGLYRLPAAPHPTVVAVRITDIYGHETLVTRTV